MADTKNIAMEIIGIPIFIIGILTIFTDWPFMQILAISLACGFAIAITDLTRTKSAEILSKQPEQQTDQQPTPTIPRKFSIGIIAIIFVIATPLGIIFFLPSGVEKVKSVISREEKIPDIPMKCVIDITDFRGEDRIKTGDHIDTDINSKGHLIVRTTDDDWSATIYLVLDKKLQEKKAVSMKCLVKVTNNGQSNFGGYIEENDDSLRTFTFNNQIKLFIQDGKNTDHTYSRKINGKYEITLTRILSDNNKTAELRVSVNPSLGEKSEKKVIYDLFSEKNLTKIGLDFYSDNQESQLEISEIIVYASEN